MKKLLMNVAAISAAVMMNSNVALAEERVYEYTDDGIVNESLELKVEAKAGQDYKITVEFTGISESYSKLSLGYDMVIADQMVQNVDSSNDRSGLIDESVIAGTTESRTFNVAAVNDGITIKATGSGKITKITVSDYETEKSEEKVIFTIGDSLVQTYTEYYAPQTGWGQTLQGYFDESKVLVKNHALGGRSSGSYMREGRLNEVLLNVKEGDYVLIEFGHNDASKNKLDRYTSVEDYKLYLEEQYIKAVRQRGGIPVLVTLCNRNDYNKATGVFNVSFERYVVAMREVAEATDTLLVDLNARTVKYFTELNEKYGVGITEEIIFNYADAGEYEGAYAEGVADNTHLQEYGAKLVAGMVAEELCKFDDKVLSDSYIATGSATAVPEAPTKLEIQSMIRTYRKIGWNGVKDADFYKVYVAEIADGKAGEYEAVGYATSSSYVYGAADIKKDYMFKVVAVNSFGESADSEELLYEAVGNKNNQNKPDNGDEANTDDSDESNKENKKINLGLIAYLSVFVAVILAVVGIGMHKKSGNKGK